MAAVAIDIHDDTELPFDDVDDEHPPPPPPTCCGRWIVKCSHFLTTVAGNGHRKTWRGVAYQRFVRLLAFLCGPSMGLVETLWPCWGDKTREQCAEDNAASGFSPVMFFVPMFIGACAVVVVGIRVHRPANVKLRQKHEGRADDNTYTALDVARAILVVFFCLMALTGVDTKALDDPELQARGTSMLVFIATAVAMIGMMIMTLAARRDSAEHFSRTGRSAFHSHGLDFHSRILLCHSMTGLRRYHKRGQVVETHQERTPALH